MTGPAIWLIDPVYAAEGRTSPNTRLLAIATRELNQLLGGDLAFSHRFSRWPLHRSSDPTAYRWHCQHNQIVRLSDLVTKVRRMNNNDAPDAPARRQFASGRDRIQAAQDAAAQARAWRELRAELPSAEELAPAAHGIIEGVRVIWASPGRAARDETAFRHALTTAHRMRAAGEALKDAKIIDAYERGYNVAQAVGADSREPDMPPMRDRLTMARRVRGYVIAGNTNPSSAAASTTRMDSAGRKALATLGSRGGKTAAKRWEDPNSDYARQQRAKLTAANQRRAAQGGTSRGRVLAFVSQQYAETGAVPSRAQIMQETGLSKRMVAYHLAALRNADLLPL
ncbi:replication initiation protein [Brachybacterium nesterenkovii]|uniref:Putative plasmid replication protein n=1 Tax=Brachybacterium nesterenkovii TaxID=47847 RepID=A0A1X6X252_9MICO|nr:replication initiation protein [Brachybacterium nesterenkovii]SLM92692.1 Putative plasmid replication protein [Brachybacterium nesterenkovii]